MLNGYRFGAVIPAAGLSSRMRRFKLLLPFGESTVIETVVAQALTIADTAVVVLGKGAEEVAPVLERRFSEKLKLAYNPDYACTDMLRSVQIGLQRLADCDAFFLVPADMPLITPQTYRMLTEAFDADKEVLMPLVGGKRGHPPLLSASLIPEIMTYQGEGGLRAVLGGHRITELPLADRGALIDLDTPEDYERYHINK